MSFSEDIIETVWEKGRIIQGYEESLIRKDCCGAWIMRNKYGDRSDGFGWEIDHVYPKALGGNDALDNLRPMHWQNNESKSDDYPGYEIAVTSDGNKNISVEKRLVVNENLQAILKDLYGAE